MILPAFVTRWPSQQSEREHLVDPRANEDDPVDLIARVSSMRCLPTNATVRLRVRRMDRPDQLTSFRRSITRHTQRGVSDHARYSLDNGERRRDVDAEHVV